LERSLFETRRNANEYEVLTFSIADGMEPLVDQYHAPDTRWCPLWYEWLNTGGKTGEEPPKEVKRLWEIYQKEAISTTSESQRNALIREAMRLHSENLWIIGTVGISWMMAVVKNNLRNVPEEGIVWHPGSPGCTRPEQFFFKK
jgi:peptide/nickel transport system substrate-binding protein